MKLDIRGWLLVVAPLVGVASMLLLDSPWYLVGSFSVIVVTALLVAIDASAHKIQGSHLVMTLLVWPVGYLSYLHARGQNGAPKKLVFGCFSALLFFLATPFSSGSMGSFTTKCKVVSPLDAECTLRNEGVGLARGCFELSLHRTDGGSKVATSKKTCVRVFPGETTLKISSPWPASSKKACQEQLVRVGEDKKPEHYDDESEREENESHGGIAYCVLHAEQW